jgi:hypothetical protein
VEVDKPHPLPVFSRFANSEHAHHPLAPGAFSNQASNHIPEFNQHSSLAHSASQHAGPLVSSDVYSPNNGKANATQDHSLSIAASFNDTSHHHPGSGHSAHQQLNNAPVGHSYPDQPHTQTAPFTQPYSSNSHGPGHNPTSSYHAPSQQSSYDSYSPFHVHASTTGHANSEEPRSLPQIQTQIAPSYQPHSPSTQHAGSAHTMINSSLPPSLRAGPPTNDHIPTTNAHGSQQQRKQESQNPV